MTITLGANGPEVSRIGLGCMGMSGMYGPADRRESIATIHAALDAGITLLDTGDFYGMGHNELLISEALRTRDRDEALISVKFGALRGPDMSWLGYDAAAAVHPISDLQIEYSLISRAIESQILPVCREQGIAITAYGVLSRGLISGHWTPDRSTTGTDFRNRAPRFQGENLERNLALVDALRAVADGVGASVAQVAIAGVLSRGEDIIPLIGARTRERLTEALGALELDLSAEDLSRIEQAMPADAAAGDRYPEAQMGHLDSERA
jgi:aryl-alcohol dehydrogenase-like predicted oxidoreductase